MKIVINFKFNLPNLNFKSLLMSMKRKINQLNKKNNTLTFGKKINLRKMMICMLNFYKKNGPERNQPSVVVKNNKIRKNKHNRWD